MLPYSKAYTEATNIISVTVCIDAELLLGLNKFFLLLQIEWPLSIVISQQAMTQYQLIFRHLFELKYVERQLNGVWQVLQATRGLFR